MNTQLPRILIADDDHGWREALRARLSHEGFDVVMAESGADAIQAFEEDEVDLALLDVHLPDMDGFAICEHIRSQPSGCHLPVIMLTGCDSGIVRRHLHNLSVTVGSDRCLTKTCDSSTIVSGIRDLLKAQPATVA